MANSSIVGTLKVLLTANVAEFKTAMERATDSAKDWEKSLKSTGRQATELGSALTKTLTVPLAGLGVMASKLAIDFESSFAGVIKTVDDATDEFGNLTDAGKALQQGMRDLSKTIPINVNELNKIGEAAGQLGIKTENILGFTEVMAKLGVTTSLSAEEAAVSLAQLANITQMPQTEFERLGSTIVHLGNNLATNETKIVDFGLRIAGAGELAGLAEHEILAIGAAMASVGVEAEAGGTAVQKVLNDMTAAVATGGKSLEIFAATAGMSAEQFKTAWKEDAGQAFAAFVAGLDREGDNAFRILDALGLGNERVIRAFLSLANAGDTLTESLRLGAEGWRENTALTEEAHQRFKTTEAQLTLLWNRLKDVGITFGNALRPAIELAVSALDKLIPVLEVAAKWFESAPAGIQLVAVGFGVLAAAAGPLIYVFGQLALSAAALSSAFAANGLASRGLSAAWGTLGAAGTGLVGVLGRLVLGFGGVALAIGVLHQRSRDALKGTYQSVEEVDAAIEKLERRLEGLSKAQPGGREGSVVAGAIANIQADLAALRQVRHELTLAADVAEAAAGGTAEAIGDVGAAVGGVTRPMTDWDKLLADGSEAKKLAAERARALAAAFREIGSATDTSYMKVASFNDLLASMAIKWDTVPGLMRASADATVPVIEGIKAIDLESQKAAVDAALLGEAYKTLGVTSQAELDATARAAKTAYEAILRSGTATLEDLEAAREAWMEAERNAAREHETLWDRTLKSMAASFEQTFTNMLTKTQSWRDGFVDILGTALQGFSDAFLRPMVNQFSLMVTKSLGMFAGLAGSLMTGGIMAAASAGIQWVTGLFRGNTTKDARDQFAAQYGGDQALWQQLRERGRDDLVHQALNQIGKNDTQANQQWMREVEQALAQPTLKVQELTGKFNDLTAATEQFGGKAPQAFQPLIAQLLASNKLTSEHRSLLESMQGQPSWEVVEQKAKKYGISLEALGGQFQQAKLDDIAVELASDFEFLIDQGADMNGVLRDMADEAQGVVNAALKFGTEIPDNMRPMLQALIDMGLLTDENGDKLDDLSRFKFKEKLESPFDRIANILEQIVVLLGGEIPDAAKDGADKTQKAWDGVKIKIPIQYDVDDPSLGFGKPGHSFEGPEVPGFATGTGGWMDFGVGSLAMLHGLERVQTPAQAMAERTSIVQSVTAAAGTGAPAINVNVAAIQAVDTDGVVRFVRSGAFGREVAAALRDNPDMRRQWARAIS